MNKILVTLFFVLLSTLNYAQQLAQTIRGKIIDVDSRMSIPGVVILESLSKFRKGISQQQIIS